MKYVADALGIEVNIESWGNIAGLPYYLIDRYDFKKADLDGVSCLFMKPKGEPETLTAIKKHITNVRKIEQLPVVLELDGMTARRRKSLIEARIPFIAPGCQIYLPFLGVVLSERYNTVTPPSIMLMPSAQLLLFYYLYQDKAELYAGETADVFGVSAMQVSRAIKQLTTLGLMSARKDGVRTVIYYNERRCDLFERSKPHLVDPVRKRIFIEKKDLPDGLPLSGYSALSELTMLGGSALKTFAFFGKAGELTGTDTLVDNFAQAEVELWRYDPALLSKNPGVVDTLSLVTSIDPGDDERVEQAIDELLETVWGE
jgi:DNA-binding transcriptional ArsR family regulator